MQIPKPADADRERFKGLVPSRDGVEVKPMFGNLGAFVNGNMFMGLFGANIGVRLDGADATALRESGGGDFGPAGHAMGGYVTLPAGSRPEAWVAKALDHVSAMPPKVKKPRK